MVEYFQPEWPHLLKILIVAPTVYVFVIFAVRAIGIRSTSQMNSFDWIVTVAMGSLVASTIILKDISLIEGVFSISLLLILQYMVTRVVSESSRARLILKATPQLLLFKGDFLNDNMINSRITRGEVYSAIRQQGYKSTQDVYAVVLETNAKLSVIPNENNDEIGFSLSDVEGLPKGLRSDLEKRGEEE